jgi:hypothetical protein
MAAYTTIDDPEVYFQVVTWNGNADTNAVTFGGETDMQPDLIWGKDLSGDRHFLADAVRGKTGTGYYLLASNNTESDIGDSNAPPDGITSIDSNGFTLGANTSNTNGGWSYEINEDKDNGQGNSGKYVAWCWKESATAGFDIVAFEGNTTARTISHSLSAVPHFIIVKERDNDNNWIVYHHKNTSAPETDFLKLESTDATYDDATAWNDTAPTSSVFSVGAAAMVNRDSMITYLFTSVQGFSKFGSYTGNGNADGTFIYTGFRPAWLMFKRTDASSNAWIIVDNKRNTFNPQDNWLASSSGNAEATHTRFDFLSNGFKARQNYDNTNASGGNYIYMAFAEAPFVNSNGVPCNAR